MVIYKVDEYGALIPISHFHDEDDWGRLIFDGEVLPIDDYVLAKLREARERFGIEVDLDAPTRAQRLEIALAYFEKAHDPVTAYEVMLGKHCEGQADNFERQVRASLERRGFEDYFRRGIHHSYFPEGWSKNYKKSS